MITIYFEPHSITTDNENHLASGWNDVDLSAEGVKLLNEQWPARYKDRFVDAIFCSDMQRSYKCGAVIAKDKHIPIYIDSRLRECNYGELTQKDKKVVDAEKPKRISTPFPEGESYQQCMERMDDFLNMLRDQFQDKTVVIIGHRATQYGLEHHINGKDILTCVTEPWTYQPGWKYEF
ncbi:MAG TPA: histidine phosphatase family protein [Candidatus Saccharibacteria bacterium]|nr:histidine phosphatase family protein [Candidatus Saccharibacteria bacterium]